MATRAIFLVPKYNNFYVEKKIIKIEVEGGNFELISITFIKYSKLLSTFKNKIKISTVLQPLLNGNSVPAVNTYSELGMTPM